MFWIEVAPITIQFSSDLGVLLSKSFVSIKVPENVGSSSRNFDSSSQNLNRVLQKFVTSSQKLGFKFPKTLLIQVPEKAIIRALINLISNLPPIPSFNKKWIDKKRILIQCVSSN